MEMKGTLKMIWTTEHIKFLLQHNDLAVERALVALLERQTADEQLSEATRVHNNRGFTQADAAPMSQMAKDVRMGRRLSKGRLNYLRTGKSTRYPSRIGKYARQLAEIANAKVEDCNVAIMRYLNMKQPEKAAEWEARRAKLLPTNVEAAMVASKKLLV
jgi:hypothetical protein